METLEAVLILALIFVCFAVGFLVLILALHLRNELMDK